MHIVRGSVPHARRLARVGAELSRAARLRLQRMDYYQAHGRNAALTCRHCGISRQTFYRWRRRYDPHRPDCIGERSHRPRRVRQPTWSQAPVLAVLHLREQYPRWGKDKLGVLLRGRGWAVSTSTAGRTLAHLKARGALKEPVPSGISTRKRLWRRPYAVRKPKDYPVQEPGDVVHVDGGSEFQSAGVYPERSRREQACQQRGIRLFVLPPRSPKLNGCVERAQRTHTEECYEVVESSREVAALNRELLAWEQTYNTIRPHQALGYLTLWQSQRKEAKCH